MHILLLLMALAAPPVQYQALEFQHDPPGGTDGTLNASEETCVESFFVSQYPFETEGDLLTVQYARQDIQRSHSCVTFWVERTEDSEDFVNRTEEPMGAVFSADGVTVTWPERLETLCKPRGLLNSLITCLNSYPSRPGLVTGIFVSRDDTEDSLILHELWQVVTEPSTTYGQERSQHRARSHAQE